MMNLSSIKIDITYKNYKSLCDTLNEPIKSGKSKQIQLQDWKRYFNYNKNGNSFIITDIFDIPKEKIDNRKDNGGNSTSIISDYIHDLICNELEECLGICNSKSGIIKQLRLVKDDFSNVYYNFDDYDYGYITKNNDRVLYNSIQKEFFFDFCDSIMNSYKSRLKRILDRLDNVTIQTYYRVTFPAVNKYGDEYIDHDDIADKIAIQEINNIKSNLEKVYGVESNKDKWKIFSSRSKTKEFYSDFISHIKTFLKRNEITNCYEILYITPDKDFEPEYKLPDDYFDKFVDAQNKLMDDKIKSVFNLKKSIWDSYQLNYIKVPKYNKKNIPDELINDCKDMIDIGNANIDDETGEVLL